MIDITEFRLRRTETIVWCNEYSSPDAGENALRSPLLKPALGSLTYGQIDPNSTRYERRGKALTDPKANHYPTSEEIEVAIDQLSAHRRQLIKNRFAGGLPTDEGFVDGRLLAYWPGGTRGEGYCALLTDYFLDDDDSPPWDTWIAWVQEDVAPTLSFMYDETRVVHWSKQFLISWVPVQFVGCVQEAVEGNTSDVIFWLSEIDCPLTAELARHNLLA